DAGEGSQTLGGALEVLAQLAQEGQGPGGVAGEMEAGPGKLHRHRAGGTGQPEAAPTAIDLEVVDTPPGSLPRPVGEGGSALGEAGRSRVVQAGDHRAVDGAYHLHETLLEAVSRPEMVHVILFHVGDDQATQMD